MKKLIIIQCVGKGFYDTIFLPDMVYTEPTFECYWWFVKQAATKSRSGNFDIVVKTKNGFKPIYIHGMHKFYLP